MRLAAPLLVVALVACSAKKRQAEPAPPAPAGSAGSAAATPPSTAPPTAPQAPLPPLPADPGGGTGAPRWLTSFGGLGNDAPRSILVDERGSITLAGLFSAEASLGALGARTAVGKSDGFVMSLDDRGEPKWVVTMGGPDEDVINGVASHGELTLAVGNFIDKLSVQGADRGPPLVTKGAGSDDMVAVCIDRSGSPQWVWKGGGFASDGLNTVATAADGWILGGSFSRHAEFDHFALDSKGDTDAVLIKMSFEGEVKWVKQFGGRYGDSILRVAIDGNGNIFVQGIFADVAEWGTGPLKAGGGSDNDVVLAKYDRDGTPLWAKRFGSAFNEVAGGITVDPSGFVTMTGSFDQSVDFGNGEIASAGESDIYVARFSPGGELVWVHTFGKDREDIGYGIASDTAGNVFVSGWFQHIVDFGGGPKSSYGNRDVFLVKLDAKGRHVWSTTFGDRDHDQARALAVDGKGNPILAGVFRFDIGVGAMSAHSVHAPGDKLPAADIFVAAFDR
jgi:hypothetical protein